MCVTAPCNPDVSTVTGRRCPAPAPAPREIEASEGSAYMIVGRGEALSRPRGTPRVVSTVFRDGVLVCTGTASSGKDRVYQPIPY